MSHFLLHTYVYTHGLLLFLAFFSFFLQWVIVNTEIHNSSECGVQIVAEFLAISGTTIIDLTPPKAQGTSRIGSGNFVRPRHYWRVLWNNAFWHEMAIILMNSLHFLFTYTRCVHDEAYHHFIMYGVITKGQWAIVKLIMCQ